MRVSIAKFLDQDLGECFLLLGMCDGDTLWITFRGRSKKMYLWAHSVNRVNVSWRKGKMGRERLFRRKFGNGEGNYYQRKWNFA